MMITDNEIRTKGMQALIQSLGRAQASRFITLTIQAPLDYTEWRKHLFEGMTLEELFEDIEDFEKSQKRLDVVS